MRKATQHKNRRGYGGETWGLAVAGSTQQLERRLTVLWWIISRPSMGRLSQPLWRQSIYTCQVRVSFIELLYICVIVTNSQTISEKLSLVECAFSLP